jgi:glycosyltransferase involved in cell wall biosynthesis
MTSPASDRRLRVAVVHSYYSSRQPSGENVVVDLQVDALRRAGHEVEVIARRTDDLQHSLIYPVTAALRVASGRGASPRGGIEAFAPDIVHVHNLFPNFGRSWALQPGPPIVTTLHNYRPMCPAGTLFRDGASCTLCPDHADARHAVVHACYKGSRVATWPLARSTKFADDPLLTAASRIFTLNDDMLEQYAAIGVPAEKLVTVPNFVPDPGPAGAHDGGYWLYVGRLSPEKGILQLLRQWPEGLPLKVAGSGPLEAEVAAAAGASVELLGQVSGDRVTELLAGAKGLVFPSLWPEGLPTVYLEALAAGTPVLASPESVVGRLVAEQGTGLVQRGVLEEDLAEADRLFPGLQVLCRTTYAETYTEAAWVRAVEAHYREVIATRVTAPNENHSRHL